LRPSGLRLPHRGHLGRRSAGGDLHTKAGAGADAALDAIDDVGLVPVGPGAGEADLGARGEGEDARFAPGNDAFVAGQFVEFLACQLPGLLPVQARDLIDIGLGGVGGVGGAGLGAAGLCGDLLFQGAIRA